MTANADQVQGRRRAWHPPLTDFPIAAYVFAAAFDVISATGGAHHGWAREFWHAGTFVLVAGASICVLTVLTGFRDLLTFSGRGPLPVRTISVHVLVMVGVFVIGIADIAWRLRDYQSQASTPAAILACSLVAAVGVCIGAAYGGTLVFREGFSIAMAVRDHGTGTGPGTGPGAENGTGAGLTAPPADLLTSDAARLTANAADATGPASPADPGDPADPAAQPPRHRARRSR
jgi:uncharacterized membrane protein